MVEPPGGTILEAADGVNRGGGGWPILHRGTTLTQGRASHSSIAMRV
jgi:hypothetical protein